MSVATEHSIWAVARDSILALAAGSLNGVTSALSFETPAVENTCRTLREPAGWASHRTTARCAWRLPLLGKAGEGLEAMILIGVKETSIVPSAYSV